jgi:hypothetical protein
MTALSLQPLLIFQIEVKPPMIIGATPGYDRRIGEIAGGRFEGEKLRGKILSGGSDWQSLRADGTTTINVRLVMETDDGALIGMTYLGMRHGPREVLDRLRAAKRLVRRSTTCVSRLTSKLLRQIRLAQSHRVGSVRPSYGGWRHLPRLSSALKSGHFQFPLRFASTSTAALTPRASFSVSPFPQ